MNATPISGKPSYNVSTSHILQDYQTLKKAALESLDGELPIGAIDLGRFHEVTRQAGDVAAQQVDGEGQAEASVCQPDAEIGL